MPQTRFVSSSKPPEKIKALDEKLDELFNIIKSKFKTYGKFEQVITQLASCHANELVDEQDPEEFAKEKLIEPLIRFLGYEIVSETNLPAPSGRKKPDYTIRPVNREAPIFYVEAESFNTDLLSEGHGVSQVKSWLVSRASKTDYGIATDGFSWIIRKYDASSVDTRPFYEFNLRPIFTRLLKQSSLLADEKLQEEVREKEEDFLSLEKDSVVGFLDNNLVALEEATDEISKNFYNDYVRYVFGIDEKGNNVSGAYLLSRIKAPSGVSDKEVRLFSVVFMNRLIFIKFLEEKGIVPKNLLKTLLNNYKSSPTTQSFYETYLRGLFYEVFNKSINNRISHVRTNALYSQIPYLNGGLFREAVVNERNYNIENEGVELILENLLEKKRQKVYIWRIWN